MNLQPLEDRIVVRPAEAEETTHSGLVIPDHYRLDRAGVVLERKPGLKKVAVRRAPNGGTIEEKLPRELVERLCLSDDQLQELNWLAGPAPEGMPGNLYQPHTDETRRHGDFSSRARRVSVYTWMETHRWARGLALAALERIPDLIGHGSHDRPLPRHDQGADTSVGEAHPQLPAWEVHGHGRQTLGNEHEREGDGGKN